MIRCKEFRAPSWDQACRNAEAYIATLTREQMVEISHVSEAPYGPYGLIFIWYDDLT